MSSTSPPHCSILTRLNRWSHTSLTQKRVGIRVQCPIESPDWETPLVPDLAWVQDKNYYRAHPTPPEVQLIIEVADPETLEDDCGRKMKLLAKANIPEYWVVNLQDCLVYVFRKPGAMAYQEIRTLSFKDELSPAAFPEIKLPVLSLLAVP